MNAASAKARLISRMTTHIVAVIVLAAGCAQLPSTPSPCPQCPPPKPAPETARYEAVPFADLPGWNHALMAPRSEEHTSELQSRLHLVCRLLLEKKNTSAMKHDHSLLNTYDGATRPP